MSKAKKVRPAVRKKSSPQQSMKDSETSLRTEGEFFEALTELVEAGLLKLVANEDGSDAVMVLVPQHLVVDDKAAAESRAEEDRILFEQHAIPPILEKQLRSDSLALWHGFARLRIGPLIESLTGRPSEHFVREYHDRINPVAEEFSTKVFMAGFQFALQRYSSELKAVPELATWHQEQTARKAGGDRGRQTARQRKQQRFERIRATWAEMLNAGITPTNAAVAKACGCGVSTVIRAFKEHEPAGREQR
jgi:hypothetical protein